MDQLAFAWIIGMGRLEDLHCQKQSNVPPRQEWRNHRIWCAKMINVGWNSFGRCVHLVGTAASGTTVKCFYDAKGWRGASVLV